MTTDRGALGALLATMTVLGAVATPAAAQTEPAAPVRGLERLQTPGTQATPDTSAVPVPPAPTIVLPSAEPAPRRATRPSAATTPATDRATAQRATRRADSELPARERATTRTAPGATIQPRASDSTSSRASTPTEAAPVTTPAPQPAPTPVTDAESQPTAPTTTLPSATTPQSTVSEPQTGSAMPLWLSLTAIVVVLGALWALRRKPRGSRSDRIEPEAYVEPIPERVATPLVTSEPVAPEQAAPPIAAVPQAPAVVASAAPGVVIPAAAPKFLEPRAKTPPAAPRARLTCELRPLRAGLNLLSATVECELVVTNTGTVSAEAIRAGVALLTAHADQDQDLAQFNAAPVVRPIAPPFVLSPGETRTIRTVTAIAREAIRTMTAANRPMFVPVVAANILYATAGDDAQTARAWVVGIERTDSAKLAPFWLDGPAKMFTTVAAKPHAAIFER